MVRQPSIDRSTRTGVLLSSTLMLAVSAGCQQSAAPNNQPVLGKRVTIDEKENDTAIRLDPGHSYAHCNRSIALMILRRGEAVSGFKTVLDLEGGKGNLSTYAVILGHLAARSVRDAPNAKTFLDLTPARLNALAWPHPVVKLLRGELGELTLLQAVVDDDVRTDARCFLGLDHALKGHRDEALAHLRWVRDDGNPASVGYTLALAELAHLENPRAAAPHGRN